MPHHNFFNTTCILLLNVADKDTSYLEMLGGGCQPGVCMHARPIRDHYIKPLWLFHILYGKTWEFLKLIDAVWCIRYLIRGDARRRIPIWNLYAWPTHWRPFYQTWMTIWHIVRFQIIDANHSIGYPKLGDTGRRMPTWIRHVIPTFCWSFY